MEDDLSELVPPDILASHEYWDNLRRKTPLQPEQALMLAVLEDAVRCIRNNARTGRSRACREAVEWIVERDSDHFFSFENICAVLGLDASYLRKGILSWPGHAVARSDQRSLSTPTHTPTPPVAFRAPGARPKKAAA
jgi:hypothetical protein